MAILEQINSPKDLKSLSYDELNQLASEIRQLIIEVISQQGGHLASSLGAVELALALHLTFNAPQDKIIWDVGHQSYTHKIITGRREQFSTIRQQGGLSGFPRRAESVYDAFGTGHSSTSISAALGMAKARDLKGEKHKVIAVIGDGALGGGMAFEAMNNAGHLETDLIVVLNDNEMSIAKNVGALAGYLSQLRMKPVLQKVRHNLRTFVRNIPWVGERLLKTARSVEEHLTYFLFPGVLFEALGFSYFGPFDGHNIEQLHSIFEQVRNIEGPRIIHVITQKGRGFALAEQDAVKFHGIAPFDIETGHSLSGEGNLTYTEVFGETMLELAAEYPKLVAVTAAMPDGTGLQEFARRYPERFFDVGIAEEHAVTFAAALAAEGFQPVVAIYSTFLQRAFDQIIHDVCLQELPVIFTLDRAGIVGEDGATHQGIFDLSYLRLIPNLVLAAPKDEEELRRLLKSALLWKKPAAIRYPRSRGVGIKLSKTIETIPLGRSETLKEGEDLAILAVGNTVYPAILAARILQGYKLSAEVVNTRFIKPLDQTLLEAIISKHRLIITVEENVISAGFGSAVLEWVARYSLKGIQIKSLALPDAFVEHANSSQLREFYHLTAEGIAEFALSAYKHFWEAG
jgi:1-deoxy-D-xylulose-5-phosphate synthase